MILQALVELAKNEKLIADPDFEFKAVGWIVRLDTDGNVLAIEDNRQDLNEGTPDRKGKLQKPKFVGRDVLIPLFPTGRSGTKPKASFLVDMAKFVFGIDPANEANPETFQAYVQRFRQLVVDCESATSDASVRAVREFLDRVLAGRASAALPEGVSPSDLFMFRVGDDETPVHLKPEVVAFWKRIRAAPSATAGPGERWTCLITGESIEGKPPLFPLIKGVPGAGTMGSGLLPFNGPSSRTWSSYGMEGNENAPVSRTAAEAAATALNRLADPRPTDGAGNPLPVRRIRLSNDTIVVYWASEAEPEVISVLDSLPELVDPHDVTADVGNMIASYRTATFRPLRTPAKFYAVTVTGTTGRIIVRDWFETTVAKIQENIAAYFADLRLLRAATRAQAGILHESPLPSLLDVKLAVYRELDQVPAPFAREWIRVIWGGTQARVPGSVVARVNKRIQIALSRGEEPSAHAFGLIKLSIVREGDLQMISFVNEEHPAVAYHCGRLLAVLDYTQQKALGLTNTSNVRRMLGAILTAPALYLGRIRRLAEVAYFPKMDGDLPKFLRDRLRAISGRIGDAIPSLLQMREQSTFFLGFDQEWSYLETHPPKRYRLRTSIGLWVLSTGERDVVEALTRLGRHFIYEPGLRTLGDATRLPDFLIDGDTAADHIFIEYLGMLDTPEYVDRWKQKLEEYRSIGLLPIDEGGGKAGKLIVLDHRTHPDFTSIYTELKKHLGRPLADEDTTNSEGANS